MHGLCDHPGCNDPAVCRPVIYVHTKRRPEGGIAPDNVFLANYVAEDRHVICYNTIGYDYCSYHQGAFNLKKWMTEATWSAIENQVDQLGLERPHKDSVTVVWEDACGAMGLTPEEERKMLLRRA
jgi:hypothetical protein